MIGDDVAMWFAAFGGWLDGDRRLDGTEVWLLSHITAMQQLNRLAVPGQRLHDDAERGLLRTINNAQGSIDSLGYGDTCVTR